MDNNEVNVRQLDTDPISATFMLKDDSIISIGEYDNQKQTKVINHIKNIKSLKF